MNSRKFLAAAILSAVFVSGLDMSARADGDEARLLRFPSTNGREAVFSYAGDLFTVPLSGGEAVRLTSHVGYEAFAHYSPDGKQIAFTGEYDGNREVYLIPASGGEPVRLTYTATNSRDDMGDRMGPNNIVMGWTPDGEYVIYRNRSGDGFPGALWKAPVRGGMPVRIPLPEGGFCSYSPDGSRLAYNRVMREFRTWKYYRGGMADDIWVYDGKKVERITDSPAQDVFPMWIGDKIYFASDRDMTMNLFGYDTVTGKLSKLTDFKDFDVKFPSAGGGVIVFENAGFLYKFDPSVGKAEKVNVSLSSDFVYAREERKFLGGRADMAYSLSPDGRRAAVTSRGEVFDIPVGKGVTRNITKSPGSNDRGAEWSPDGRFIAFIGDSTGETEVYVYDVSAGGAPRQLTKKNDTYIRSLMWTPDSRNILYTDRKNRLVSVDAASGARKTLLQCPERELRLPSVSPDGKWLAYTRPASNNMSVVYLMDMASGKEYPVTEKWYDSYSPVFSSDGKYLLFSSERDLVPIYSSVEWNYAYGDTSGLYMTMLASDTPSPLIPGDSESYPSSGKADASGVPAGASSDVSGRAAPAVEVRVDPEGLAERIVKLPFKGSVIHCDGGKVWYRAGGSVQVYDFRSAESSRCSDAMLYYRSGDKFALMRDGGAMKAVNFPAAAASGGESLCTEDMYAMVDYSMEWPEIFDEVWRAFRDGYYLENMHGRDWKAIKEKYAPLVPYAKTRLDLNYVIGEMISELASGHAYVNPGEYPKAPRVDMGLLGARLSKDKGYFRIDHIYAGAPYREELRSPLTEPGMNVREGEYITALDGVSLKDVDNIYRLLVGKAGRSVELTVSSSASEGGRKIVVRPVADEYPLEHYEWVQRNIALVDSLSGGKVGYIYVPDMSAEGLNEFVRWYYPQLDKEALIIDDRVNGGGNVSPMLIERLMRVAYRMTMRRGSTVTGTIPDGTHTGPKVLLINKYSASDGDLFPWSFKANNLGTVIGTRTWGGIVGISGSLPYMDGTDVRVPFFTNYDARTGEWIVENHGVDPDIELDNDPVREYAGEDQQLEKAVEVALEQIKTQRSHKNLPGVPAPRTFKDLGLPESW